MPNVTMKSKDTIAAALAEVFCTINGNRYNVFQAINLEANFEMNKTQIPILGKTGKGNKTTGWGGNGRMTLHYNTSIFREIMERYKNTGEVVYFDIQIINEDPSSSAGKQVIMLIDCTIDGGVLAKFDADGEYLDEEVSFTFEDFKMPQTFNLLDGML